ncbi:MAG: hypothetical protein ACOC83_07735 [Gemmatimonadota bacterium]
MTTDETTAEETGTSEREATARRELRRAHRDKREAQLRELSARLDLLEAKAQRAKADARIRYEEEIGKVREKLDTARVKLSLLQDAGEQAWEDVRGGLDEAMSDLRDAFRRASSRFE